jgi:hypothetical protein
MISDFPPVEAIEGEKRAQQVFNITQPVAVITRTRTPMTDQRRMAAV